MLPSWSRTASAAAVAMLLGVTLIVMGVSQHAARTGLLQFEDEQLVVAAPELALMKPRRMFLYKNVPAAPMQSLEETIGPGSLEIDPGREGAGVGGGSDEQGQCFADVTCGPSCAKCEKCQCLMDDGRTLDCKFGKCSCLRQCNCESTDDCGMDCGLDYSPELCGQKHCRAGKCYVAFELPLEDPEWRIRRAR